MPGPTKHFETPILPVNQADAYSPAHVEQRRLALESANRMSGFQGIDEHEPSVPTGHALAVRKSTLLTSYAKQLNRDISMDISPQDVVDVLTSANVKNWVLMGLHGYVGYMPTPRATQDVDVMVPYSERAKVKKAILARWPELVVRELSQVTRFLDPLDKDRAGEAKPSIDVMHPWAPFQELILKDYVLIDEETHHRIPTLEAALVAKYAAMISPNRDRDKREYDAGDFRRIVRSNRDHLNRDNLRTIASLVWEDGADDIERFVSIAISDSPFPI
jgi:hypothetical protein